MNTQKENELTRRRLLQNAAGAAVTMAAASAPALSAPTSPALAPPPAGADDDYAFLLLGDLHFDRMDQHDLAWMREKQPGDVRQAENYSRITRDVAPGLLTEIAEHAADPEKRIAFTVHIGDFVEGLAGTPERARIQCRESIALFQAFGPRVPLLFCKGNHDVTGPGAVDAWNTVLLPFVAQQAGLTSLTSSCFTQRRGDTLFAYFDAYQPEESLGWLEATLAKRTEKHLFVVIHTPVVPYDARADWHIFAKPSESAKRERLLNLLGKNRAIVLCGHLHKYGTVVRETPGGGRFVQVATISVVPSADAAPKQVLSGLDAYGPDLVRLEPEFSPKTLESRRSILTAEKPFLRHYDYADAPGYGILAVKGDQIKLDLYAGLGRRLWKTLDLPALLAA